MCFLLCGRNYRSELQKAALSPRREPWSSSVERGSEASRTQRGPPVSSPARGCRRRVIGSLNPLPGGCTSRDRRRRGTAEPRLQARTRPLPAAEGLRSSWSSERAEHTQTPACGRIVFPPNGPTRAVRAAPTPDLRGDGGVGSAPRGCGREVGGGLRGEAAAGAGALGPVPALGPEAAAGGRCAGALLGDKTQDRQEPWGWRMGQRHLQSWAGRGLRTAGLGSTPTRHS